jgi:hypothetical protein
MMRLMSAAVVMSAIAVLAGCTAAPPSDFSGLKDLAASEDEMRAVAECLEGRGWPVEWQDGTIGIDLVEEQRALYEADLDECFIEAGVDTSAGLTEDDYELIYAWHVEIADCLDGAGWHAGPRPSYEAFRSSYDSDPWIPWAVVDGPDYDEAARRCPVLNAQK